MKQLTVILIAIFGLVSCKDNSKSNKSYDSLEVKNIYREIKESNFEILSEKDEIGFTYKSVETNFKLVSIQLEKFDDKQYFASFVTTTKATTRLEGQERNIKISIKSFDNPNKTIIEINKDCDNIDLQNHTYKTAKYGCCGSLDYYEIYDYQNKQIIAGEGKIAAGFIPNSRLKIYSSFSQKSVDSTVLGTIHYSTTNGNKFDIKIISKRKRLIPCEIFSDISLQTSNKIDKFDERENEYTLWSFDKVEDENLLDNLKIQFDLYSIELDCKNKIDLKHLIIPIINGKPFGKAEKIQELLVD